MRNLEREIANLARKSIKEILIDKKSNPICNVPQIFKGNQPTDGGFLILSEEEKNEYLIKELSRVTKRGRINAVHCTDVFDNTCDCGIFLMKLLRYTKNTDLNIVTA